ncbi:CHAT domain-containing protein [Gandjariella thermophila]|nr:CHAT domain-containing protein [Gandjariella thermophila]
MLRAVELSGSTRWRWLLLDEDGRTVADHEVDVDPAAPEYEAIHDLHGYLWRNRVPDDRIPAETAIVARVGAWLGERVLGERIGRLIVAGDEDTVRVELPEGADFLPHWPLELSHVDGVSLAGRGVGLVYQWAGTQARDKQPVGDALRILALFSMPSRTSVLALRRERYELARLVRTVAARERRAVELRVLQYGVTRDRLRATAEQEPGWDVLHLAGHGLEGGLLLEHPDGSPDEVSTTDLVTLLRPARRRLKLVVLGVCHSGAATAAETMRWLRLDEQADALDPTAEVDGATVGLARGLVERLGVAAVAMRYPVSDEFAVALTAELYPRLLGGMPVDRAVALAVPAAAGERPSAGRPPLSLGTPAVFGPGAAGLTLRPPAGTVDLDPSRHRMVGFPAEPERFVGRTRLLIDAARALAPRSDRTGVLLVGMAGAGKTTAALELAYQHRDRFGALAWWQAPSRDTAPGDAIVGLAHALETQLGHLGFTMLDAVGGEDRLRHFLPRLSALLRDEAVLLVLDNLETLLSASGTWRDPMWAALVETLTGHGGESRVVLTSRTAPDGLDTDRVAVLPTHALSLAESILLARELPHLGALLRDVPGPHRGPAADPVLARRVIHVVQGHPKLLELADAAAADPEKLRARLDAAERAGADAPLGAFFATGTSDVDGAQFLDILTTWTTTALADLPTPARTLAELIACLEDADRTVRVVGTVWPQLWRTRHDGDPPSLDEAVDTLAAAALVDAEGVGDVAVDYPMHPGVAAAVRAATDSDLRATVDDLLGDLWWRVAVGAGQVEQEGDDVAGETIVNRGLAALPYLVRRGRAREAVALMTAVTSRDPSPGTAHRVLGYLRRLRDDGVETGQRLDTQLLHARVLARIDPAEGLAAMHALRAEVRGRGDPKEGARVAGELANLLRDHADLAAALEAAEEAVSLDRASGGGPWSEAGHEALVLQILAAMGHHDKVLEQATGLLERLDSLDPESSAGEYLSTWTVTETILDAAFLAACGLGDWPRALELNGRAQDSRKRRGASTQDRARVAFNAHFPLLELGRHGEAEEVLLACQEEFERAGDIVLLGRVFSARANLAMKRGRLGEAIANEHHALRYKYQRPEAGTVATSHHNLALYCLCPPKRPELAVVHGLAAALLFRASHRAANEDSGVRIVAWSSRGHADDLLPADLGELTARVEQVPGVRFGELLTELVPDAAARDALFTDIVNATRTVVLK